MPFFFSHKKFSYSQSGEDRIVLRVLNRLGIARPIYLDIGANDPIKNNNTYLLYSKGCSGVLIEPHFKLYKKIKKKRKRDIVLNKGVGDKDDESLTFYALSNDPLSTFSADEAKKITAAKRATIVSTKTIELITINSVIDNYFQRCPNFVSLDTESFDFQILSNFNFSKYKPEVFCVETITYSTDNTEEKRKEIFDLMLKNGYMVFADTYINTIFVYGTSWKNR